MDNESEDEKRAIASHALYAATLRGMDGMRLSDVALILAKLATTLQCRRIVEAVQCMDGGNGCSTCKEWIRSADMIMLTDIDQTGGSLVYIGPQPGEAS